MVVLAELTLPGSWMAAKEESHWIGYTSALTTSVAQALGEEMRTREESTRAGQENTVRVFT